MKEKNTCGNELKNCPLHKTMKVIGGKWKILILWTLQGERLRTSEIKRRLPGISQKMLIQQLRELEQDNIVLRKVYPVVPPKVEYYLTKKGVEVKSLLLLMEKWGRTL